MATQRIIFKLPSSMALIARLYHAGIERPIADTEVTFLTNSLPDRGV